MRLTFLTSVTGYLSTSWTNKLESLLMDVGLSQKWSTGLVDMFWFVILLTISWLSFHITKKIVEKIAGKIHNKINKALITSKFYHKLSYLAPLIIVNLRYEAIWVEFPVAINVLDKLINLTFIWFSLGLVSSIAKTVILLFEKDDATKNKPIKSLVQFALIIVYFVCAVIAIAVLIGRPPGVLIGGLGAASAVLMLIFKDSILGLVAGVQLSVNNMVSLGDWIVLPKYSTDGDVIEIGLTTVKVQNWDNTISTVPSYILTSDVVINWRGMSESGGRRIARTISIDMRSIAFCDDEMLERFKKIMFVKEYIDKTKHEHDEYNKIHNVDTSIRGNGKQQTNIGIFRAYTTAYLKSLSTLNKDMTLMVRQLQPTETGLPMQIYCFTATTAWVDYERIQSDIFDHLFGILPYFDLRVYQNLGGNDIMTADESKRI